jgi:hypothetical protein
MKTFSQEDPVKINYFAQAVEQGKGKHADALKQHAEEALKHAKEAKKDPHVEEGIKHSMG